jgi:glucokinase
MPHRFIAGVDIGASTVRVAVADADGEIQARRSHPFPAGTPEDLLRGVGRTIDDLVRGVWVGAKADAIGIALPGSIHPSAGTVSTPANLPGWDDVPVAALLAEGRGVPVAVENDANAAAVGEGWLGVARGLRDYVFVAIGTGIGGGVVIDGRLRHGAHFLAGEIAFAPVSREQVRSPSWQHCLEGVAGGRAFAAEAKEILGEDAKTVDLFDAAYAGHPAAAEWLRRTQEYLAMAIASACALLDPEAVVVGGGVAAAQGERFLAPVREMAHACLPAEPSIVLSSLGEDAQILGAVRLAMDRASVPG